MKDRMNELVKKKKKNIVNFLPSYSVLLTSTALPASRQEAIQKKTVILTGYRDPI